MKKHFSKLTLAIILALVMGLAFAAPAMADPVTNPVPSTPMPAELLHLGITKDLNMPPGTVIPNAAFHFTFRQAVINGPTDTPPNAVVPRNPAEAQPMAVSIPNQIINFPADYVLTEACGWANIGQLGGTTAPGGFNLGTITWPHAGQFFFVVEELHNTNYPLIYNDPLQSLSYSNESWLLMVSVINYEGALRISNIQVAGLDPITPPTWNPGTGPGEGYWTGGVWDYYKNNYTYRPGVYVPGPGGTPGNWEVNRGPSDIRFRNDYAITVIQTLADPALAVSKAVTGPLANEMRQFEFEMTLNLPDSVVLAGVWNINNPIEATITNAAGAPIAGRDPVIFPAPGATLTTTAEFTLAHGEYLRFITLPIGTTYTVTEEATPNYAASARITTGGVLDPTVFGGITQAYVEEELTVGSLVSNDRPTGALAPFNLAAFTNTNFTPEIYGLFVGTMPFVIALFGATVILAMMVASRSRQRIEQLPIAY